MTRVWAWALVAVVLTGGCATFEQAGTEAKQGFQTKIAKPVLYKLAGADPELRLHLERGQTELDA